MRPGRFVLVLSGLVALPMDISADWHVMPFVSLTVGSETNIVDLEDAAGRRKVAIGATVTHLGAGVLGFEMDLGYSPGFFERDTTIPLVRSSHVTSLMTNVVAAAPLRWTGHSLRPYASGGLGLVRVTIDDVLGILRVDRNLLGFNVGGGAIGFLTDRTGVRWDVRYFRAAGRGTSDPISFGSARLSYWRGGMALVLRY